MAVDVTGVVEVLGETGVAVAAVGVASLLVFVIREGYWYLQYALIERQASREADAYEERRRNR